MKKTFLSIAFVSLVVGAAACSSSDTDPAAEDKNVTNIQVGPGQEFIPKEVSVKVGTKVRWTFAGGLHDVVAGLGGGGHHAEAQLFVAGGGKHRTLHGGGRHGGGQEKPLIQLGQQTQIGADLTT